MDIQTEKTQLIQQLKQINDIELIKALKNLMEYALGKEEKSKYSIEDYNQEIDNAEEEIRNGEVISHSDLMNSI